MTGPVAGPIAGSVAAAFDQAAGAYDTTGTEFFTHVGQRLVGLAGIRAGARVLDVGCGKGAATIPAARAAGPTGQVTGVDASSTMLDFARAASDAAAVPGITWLRGDAEDPPVPAGSVDFLLAANLIQFLPDPRAAARRWQQLLVKDGTIALAWGVTQDPVFAPVMAAMDAAVPAPALGFEAFFRRPPFDSGDGLTQLLTECGYDEAVTRHEPVVTVYEGPEQWWQASLGQAPWAVAWRHIPPADLRAARSEAFGLLEGIRGPDGKLTRTIGFGYTIARRRRR